MDEVKNPYLDKRKELMLKADKEPTEDNQKAFEEVDALYRKWTEDKLQELNGEIHQTDEEIEEVKEKAKVKAESKTALYKESIRLYRKIMGTTKDGELVQEGLVHKARALKEMMRR